MFFLLLQSYESRMPQMLVRRPLHKLKLAHQHRLYPPTVFMFAAVNPSPQRPLFASGKITEGTLVCLQPTELRMSASRDAGVNPLRVRPA